MMTRTFAVVACCFLLAFAAPSAIADRIPITPVAGTGCVYLVSAGTGNTTVTCDVDCAPHVQAEVAVEIMGGQVTGTIQCGSMSASCTTYSMCSARAADLMPAGRGTCSMEIKAVAYAVARIRCGTHEFAAEVGAVE